MGQYNQSENMVKIKELQMKTYRGQLDNLRKIIPCLTRETKEILNINSHDNIFKQ